VVSPNRHIKFGHVFYNVMNKKPVAHPVYQHVVLENQRVYGLLSHCYAAIVVDCLTLNTIEVRYV
jgi:hypothetical protein